MDLFIRQVKIECHEKGMLLESLCFQQKTVVSALRRFLSLKELKTNLDDTAKEFNKEQDDLHRHTPDKTSTPKKRESRGFGKRGSLSPPTNFSFKDGRPTPLVTTPTTNTASVSPTVNLEPFFLAIQSIVKLRAASSNDG